MPLQAVEVAIRLLQMTAAAGHFLQENRLYKSFRLLQRVREALPEDKSAETNSRCASIGYLLVVVDIYCNVVASQGVHSGIS